MILLLALPALLAAQKAPSLQPGTLPPLPSLSAPVPPDGNKTVITVNGHPIQAKDLQAYLWDWNASQVGQELITKELVEQEATRQGVKLTEAEVSASVQDLYRQYGARLPKGTDVEDYLKKQGAPASRIGLEMRIKMLLERVSQIGFKPEDYVKVASVVIQPKDQTSVSLGAALKSANDAYAELQKGVAWDNVVLKYSAQPQAAANHGELGWRAISEFPKEVTGDLVKLPLKGVTQPVQTANGFQLFYIEARGKDATPGELSELKARYLPLMERDLLTKLQKDAKITTSYTP